MTHLVNNDYRKFKKSLNDLLSSRIVQKLTNRQREEVYRDVLNGLFKSSRVSCGGSKGVLDDSVSDADKLYHFDLMKETLIKIGKSLSEKFKQVDNLENDDKEIKLIQVLNDTIDHPITLPYLIPNLCECTLSSIEFLFRHLNTRSNSGQKVIEVTIEQESNKKLMNDKIDDKKTEKKVQFQTFKDRSSNDDQSDQKTDSKKLYKIYSSNKTSEYYESKRTSRRIENLDNESWNEKKSLGERIDAIASESNKLYQLNQQYRRNKEELQDELMSWKEKCHRLVNELEEKTMLIEEKENQFEGLELELNTIKVQLESIYKQNQLLDSDKLNLSSNASTLQQRIQEIEIQNKTSNEECSKLKQIIIRREEQLESLKKEFDERRLKFEQIHLKKLIDEEQVHKKRLEQLEEQENEIKLKYEKIINEFEMKQSNLDKETKNLKQELESWRFKFDEKQDENFRLTLEVKEHDLRIENLKRDKEEAEEFLKKYNDDKVLLLKKLDQGVQELSRFKKLYEQSVELIECKTNENEQLQSDLNALRNENVEISGKLISLKSEHSKQLEMSKKLFTNELNEKSRLINELKETLNSLKKEQRCIDEEKNVILKLFKLIENISNLNQTIPQKLSDVLMDEHIVNVQKFDHYLAQIREQQNEFKSKEHELTRLRESNKLTEKEYEEQKTLLQLIQQKLDSSCSQLKIKDCELIHLRDELAECKVQKNESELEKISLMKANESLKDEKSILELLKIELKQQMTSYQIQQVELENEQQLNLEKIAELDKQMNEMNEKYKQVKDELKNSNEKMIESSNVREQVERELISLKQEINKIKKMYENEKELNLNLNQVHQQSINEQGRLERELNQFKSDNQQLESELNKIENEFKDYEARYQKLVDDRTMLIDLVTKYNLILKTHLNVSSFETNENCFEFLSNNRNILKLIKPDCLMQALFDLQNEQSKLKRQLDSLKMRFNEQKIKVREEMDLNQQYRSMIEHNENSLLTKKVNCEKLLKEQRDFKVQLEQTLDENEKLKIEKSYLTEKVLNLDRILESTKEFVQRKFVETNGERMTGDQKLKCSTSSLEQYLSQFDQRGEMNLEDLEMRLMQMHDSLIEFINNLVRSIGEHKEKATELEKVNRSINGRLEEMNELLIRCRDNETSLQVENENLKKELIASNHNSKEIENRVKQLTNQITDLQDECLTLRNSLQSNRLTMNDLIETNNRMKLQIKQLEATINLCEIKIRESEQNLFKKSNQVIGRDSEIIHLKTDQSHMQDELKKLQLQNKLMNNELNQTLIRSPARLVGSNCEENLNKFITFKQHPTEPRRSFSTSNLNVSKHQRFVKKINVINK